MSGSFRVNEPATPTTPTGDINCDGNVNSIDAALALQFSAGLVGSLACEEAADVNGDGRSDIGIGNKKGVFVFRTRGT